MCVCVCDSSKSEQNEESTVGSGTLFNSPEGLTPKQDV